MLWESFCRFYTSCGCVGSLFHSVVSYICEVAVDRGVKWLCDECYRHLRGMFFEGVVDRHVPKICGVVGRVGSVGVCIYQLTRYRHLLSTFCRQSILDSICRTLYMGLILCRDETCRRVGEVVPVGVSTELYGKYSVNLCIRVLKPRKVTIAMRRISMESELPIKVSSRDVEYGRTLIRVLREVTTRA